MDIKDLLKKRAEEGSEDLQRVLEANGLIDLYAFCLLTGVCPGFYGQYAIDKGGVRHRCASNEESDPKLAKIDEDAVLDFPCTRSELVVWVEKMNGDFTLPDSFVVAHQFDLQPRNGIAPGAVISTETSNGAVRNSLLPAPENRVTRKGILKKFPKLSEGVLRGIIERRETNGFARALTGENEGKSRLYSLPHVRQWFVNHRPEVLIGSDDNGTSGLPPESQEGTNGFRFNKPFGETIRTP